VKTRPWRAPSPALVISVLALFISLGGASYAAIAAPRNSVGTAQLKNAAVTRAKIKDRAVTARKIAAPTAYHEVGAAGEPPFQNSWGNENPTGESTAGFYIDPFGTVHLKGLVVGGVVGDTVFHLPPAYRPAKYTCVSTYMHGAAYVCIASNDGAVYPAAGGSGSLLLDGITFPAGVG
jgi:hypothetical protein